MLSSPSASVQHPTVIPQPNPTRFPLSFPHNHKPLSHTLSFPKPLHRQQLSVTAKSPNSSDRAPRKSEEQKITHEGSVTESLPNGMFRVRLDNQDMIIGYISGTIRKNYIRILPGDKVRVEVSRYDSTRGRITYRLRNPKD